MSPRYLFAALTLAVGISAFPARASTEVIDRIVARVEDDIITQSDLIRMLPIYIQVGGIDSSGLATPEGRVELLRTLVDELVIGRLMLADAATRDLSVTDEEVEQYIAQQRDRMALTALQFAQELVNQGIAIEDFRDFIELTLTRLRLTQLDVAATVEISSQQVDSELAARYPDGLVETYITTSHILVMVPDGSSPEDDAAAHDLVAGYRAAIDSGTRTFEEVASEVNPDGSRSRAGRIGTFRTDELDQEYTRAALGLEAGELSEPVRSQFGWHIIRLEEREDRPAEDAADLRERVEFDLHQQESERQERAYIERLRSEAFVEILVTDFSL